MGREEGREEAGCVMRSACVCEYICLHTTSLALHIRTHSDARIERCRRANKGRGINGHVLVNQAKKKYTNSVQRKKKRTNANDHAGKVDDFSSLQLVSYLRRRA